MTEKNREWPTPFCLPLLRHVDNFEAFRTFKLSKKEFQGGHTCRRCVVRFLGEFDLKFSLMFEISDGKYLVNLLEKTFLPTKKSTRDFGANFKGNFGNFVSNFTPFFFFFGNLVQQKGVAKRVIFSMNYACNS